jgi:hypothetical protein
MIGWIKLHRKITEHWIWSKPEYFQWWVDILMSANFENKKVLIKNQVIECNRGDVLYSYETWANRWKTNKSKAMRFLKMLEKDNMICIKSETVTTRLTICKYDSYQEIGNDSETQVKRNRNASETQVKPTKESKEIKNDNNYYNDEKKEVVYKTYIADANEDIENFKNTLKDVILKKPKSVELLMMDNKVYMDDENKNRLWIDFIKNAVKNTPQLKDEKHIYNCFKLFIQDNAVKYQTPKRKYNFE